MNEGWVNGKPVFETAGTQVLLDEGRITRDGTGVPQEYPRMLYKQGTPTDHMIGDKPLKIAGAEVQAKHVTSDAELDDALADGWYLNPDLKKTKEQEHAEEMDRLRIAAGEAPRRGRPPRVPAEETA